MIYGVVIDFALALRAAKKGQKIRRKIWDAGVYVYIEEGDFKICVDGECRGYAELCAGRDILAEDWMVVV